MSQSCEAELPVSAMRITLYEAPAGREAAYRAAPRAGEPPAQYRTRTAVKKPSSARFRRLE